MRVGGKISQNARSFSDRKPFLRRLSTTRVPARNILYRADINDGRLGRTRLMIFHYVMGARALSYYYRHHSCACVQTFRWGTTIKRDRRRPAASAAPPTAAVYSRPSPSRAPHGPSAFFPLLFFFPRTHCAAYKSVRRTSCTGWFSHCPACVRVITETCMRKVKAAKTIFFQSRTSVREKILLTRPFLMSYDSAHLGFPYDRSPVIVRRSAAALISISLHRKFLFAVINIERRSRILSSSSIAVKHRITVVSIANSAMPVI